MKETKYPNIYVDSQYAYKKLKNGSFHKLSRWIDSLGYYMTSFRINKKKKYIRLHRLIAETFIPNPDVLPMINHKDGNKLNNSIENLEWCTNAYNTQEAYDMGLYPQHRKCPIRATSKDTNEIKEFSSIRECANQLGLNRKTITSILKGDKKTNHYNYNFEYM